MKDTKRIYHMVIRHAKPIVNPETKRSLDVLTEEGVKDSIEFGKSIDVFLKESGLRIYHSGANRAYQTGANIASGLGKTAIFTQDNKISTLNLEGANIPSGIPYGAKWIEELLEKNKKWEGAFGETNFTKYVGERVREHISNPWRIHNGNYNDFAISVSHGPIVEIGYAQIMKYSDEMIPQLAKEPLEGFLIMVDTKIRSESIDQTLVQLRAREHPYKCEAKVVPKENILGGI